MKSVVSSPICLLPSESKQDENVLPGYNSRLKLFLENQNEMEISSSKTFFLLLFYFNDLILQI